MALLLIQQIPANVPQPCVLVCRVCVYVFFCACVVCMCGRVDTAARAPGVVDGRVVDRHLEAGVGTLGSRPRDRELHVVHDDDRHDLREQNRDARRSTGRLRTRKAH